MQKKCLTYPAVNLSSLICF